jgi:hypothetical protein
VSHVDEGVSEAAVFFHDEHSDVDAHWKGWFGVVCLSWEEADRGSDRRVDPASLATRDGGSEFGARILL